MIDPKYFYDVLKKEGVDFFCGVPDSLLKEFCKYIESNNNKYNHVISANEGSAIAIASGYHLATGKIPLVYLQNSGIGNTINPLLSLADKEVYSIPLILLIGWRGEPGVKDEPQHIKQGRISQNLLNAIEIPFKIIDGNNVDTENNIKWAVSTAKAKSSPVAILVKKNSFNKIEKSFSSEINNEHLLTREKVISFIAKHMPKGNKIVSTTGMISRELYEQRDFLNQDHSSDFLTVGSMGHASQIALGISLSSPKMKIVCLDGDGSILMHMGGLTNIGTYRDINFFHIVLNNGAHDSVGGQPTLGREISFTKIAKACNYEIVVGPLINENEIEKNLIELSNIKGTRFLEIIIKKGSRKDLGRPKESPIHNKEIFVSKIKKYLEEKSRP